jgi:hypothetical protein
VAGRDITEGDSNVWPLSGDGLPIARGTADIGIVSSSQYWQNTSDSYDVAIGGQPFFYAINDARPYIRQTAPYRKDQFDNGAEPGEQSLTGWWIRSQSSFHRGEGIKFYDPSAGETVAYRYADSKGVDIWTKGEVTLLKDVNTAHITTGDIRTTGRRFQELRSIEWNNTKGVLLKDEYDVDKIDINGVETHFINYNAGVDAPVHGICDDGTTAYWITNTATKKTVYKKPLIGDATNTADVVPMFDEIGLISNAVMEFVKERIVMCADNKVYEFSGSATAMPTAVYTHPSTSHIYTSITASGPAIYIAGYNGIQSTIQKFTLSTAGVMPTLTSAVVAAELPVGEIVHKIYYYLGYMMIGTNKGIRAAVVSDQDGSINYGPLIVETTQPCYDFAARDRFVWCATGVDGEPGVIRIDLGNEIETLRFAYANDIYKSGVTGRYTTACAFINGTDQLAFTSQANIKGTKVTNKAKTSGVVTLTTQTAHGLSVGDVIWVQGVDAVSGSVFNSTTTTFTVASVPTTTTLTYALAGADVVSTVVSASTAHVTSPGSSYIESASTLVPTGYLTTGYIRYGTLEPKNFKRLLGRGDFTYGSVLLETVTQDGTEYDHITYAQGVDPVEVSTLSPDTAQEYVAYKFVLNRDTTTTSLGPIFKGYQAKATIATPRQRIIKFPVYCFDVETDRYNVVSGYEGKALARLQLLEGVEENGDVVSWQDLTTGESRQVVIEQVSFMRMTPPDKRFDGFGGVIEITIRTV